MTKIVLLFLIAAFSPVAAVPIGGGANAGQPAVQAVLAEIGQLIRDHYRIKPTFKPQPSAEDKAESDLLDDIRLTVDQAKEILADMKHLWGYEVRKDRIISNTSRYWEFPVKYAFNDQHSESDKQVIRAGFKLWSDNTCATFKEYDYKDPALEGERYLLIIKGSGCWSYLGMVYPDVQELSIGPGCEHVGTVAHEVGHALGVNHEFGRPDRDDYISIIWENIQVGKESNFWLKDDIDPADTGYDVTSLMHYDSLGFSIDTVNKKRVMMPHDIHHLTAIGQRARLQFNDIKRVNYAYQCITKICRPDQLTKPCKNGGYQDPKNCAVCRCPPGLMGDSCEDIESGKGAGMSECGGTITLRECSITTLSIPNYPQPYGEDYSCTWKIQSEASGLVFAFQSRPDMPCSRADTCYDFVEVRTNMNKLASPGQFFCTCGEHRGRVVKLDNTDEVLVRFASTTTAERGGAGKSTGFLLNVYATCNNTLASEVVNSCVITSTGYESCSLVSVPLCDATDLSNMVVVEAMP